MAESTKPGPGVNWDYARERRLAGRLADPGSIPGASTSARWHIALRRSSDLTGIRSADSSSVAIPGASTSSRSKLLLLRRSSDLTGIRSADPGEVSNSRPPRVRGGPGGRSLARVAPPTRQALHTYYVKFAMLTDDAIAVRMALFTKGVIYDVHRTSRRAEAARRARQRGGDAIHFGRGCRASGQICGSDGEPPWTTCSGRAARSGSTGALCDPTTWDARHDRCSGERSAFSRRGVP